MTRAGEIKQETTSHDWNEQWHLFTFVTCSPRMFETLVAASVIVGCCKCKVCGKKKMIWLAHMINIFIKASTQIIITMPVCRTKEHHSAPLGRRGLHQQTPC